MGDTGAARGHAGPPHQERAEGPGGCSPASRCSRAAPASGPLTNHDPPLPCLHAHPAWTSIRLATLSENPTSNPGTTRHPLHRPEKVAVLTPARPEPRTTPAPSRGLCPGHGAPCPAHHPASRLPVPQQPDDPPLHHPPNGHSGVWGVYAFGTGGGRAACKPVTPQLPPSAAGLRVTGPGPRAGPPRVTCTHVLGFQNTSLGTHLSSLSQEPRMDPTKPRKLPGSPGQGRGVNRQAA